ncbi:ISNCY family transposase [candidate division TA06 bacterium]|uniref:ISNCY family transposase n=1 Tax=candidate division TA06 bacterium TaxID=2250710 RepID=A0A933IB09_UNCT6|nr:ISNCY family transposase [candidate division TA06 bacterium]
MPYFRKHRTFKKLNTGRNSTPIETYLRMMYLKHRYQLGYDTLVKEVSDSFKWRRFCRVSLSSKVPDDTTLVKLTNLYGPELAKEINQELVKKLTEKKIIRGKKLRADCKAVEANIHFPTDSSLLGDGVKVINRLVKRLKESGVGAKIKFIEHTRVIKKSLRRLTKFKKLGEDKTKELCRIVIRHTRRTIKRAKAMSKAASRALRNGQVKKTMKAAVGRANQRLKTFVKVTEKLLGQSQEVLKGNHHLPNRRISVFNSKAKPIVTGKQSKKTTFGNKALVAEVEQGIVSQCQVLSGNPSETSLPKGLLKTHQETFGHVPKELATDRGLSSAKNERLAIKMGVKRVSLPARGKRSRKRKEYEQQHWFKRLQKFRAGSEGRLSYLARCFGFDRCLLTGDNGMENWTGWGVVAHNLKKTSILMRAMG